METCELEVLISTFGLQGLQRLSQMTLPKVKEVRYLVSCQCPGNDSLPVPEVLIRDDIRIIFTDTKGLSVNRNNTLAHASAPICLIADDDLSFTSEAFETIMSTFHNNPGIDIATFEYIGTDGKLNAKYPSHSFPLDKPVKGYYISSVEIAFRRQPIIDSGILFNENFGIGSPRFGCGEENLWIHDLLKAGFKGRFFPKLIAIHNHCNSTGIRLMTSSSVLRAQGAVITRIYPYTSIPRLILKAMRVSKAAKVSSLSCLPPLLYGWWQATFHSRQLFKKLKQ